MTRGAAVALSERPWQQVAVFSGPQQARCEPQRQLFSASVESLYREGGESALIIHILSTQDYSHTPLLNPFKCTVLLLGEACVPHLCSILEGRPYIPDVQYKHGVLRESELLGSYQYEDAFAGFFYDSLDVAPPRECAIQVDSQEFYLMNHW